MRKKLRVSRLARDVAWLFGAGVAATAGVAPAFAQQDSTQRLERVEVTGSAIRRVQAETALPVTVITKRDIERTGASTVNELLRSLPSADFYDDGELASNSPAGSGTATIALRGLGSSSTLVLLNGRRLPKDPFSGGGAVDVNMLPLSAIERVEILRDGASAIYGADAVAGVVNFITKTDYTGIEGRVGFGQSKYGDGTEKNIGFSFGAGNLEKDRYNFFFTLDKFDRDPVFRSDRAISRSVDFRAAGGGDRRSSFAPQGNIIDPDTFDWTGRTVQPCPPELFSGGRCRYDFNSSILTQYNAANRLGGMLSGQFKLTSDVRASLQYFFSESKNHFEAHPVPDYFSLANGDIIAGRFMQGGPRITDRKSNLGQLVAALDGNFRGFDWSVDVGEGRTRVVNRDRNYYDQTKWYAAVDGGLLDPTVNTNNAALVDSLKVNPLRVGELSQRFANLKLSGQLGGLTLAGGPILFATGAQFVRENLSDIPDALTQAGEVVGSIQQSAVDASRTSKSVFFESILPFTKTLEGQAAVRYDSYPGSNSTSPKLGLKWTAAQNLAFRASVADSYRVPTLKDLYGQQEQGASNFNGAANCAVLGLASTCDISGWEISGGNKNLKPEKGRTMSFGTILALGSNFNAIVDVWNIKIKDGIDSLTVSQAIQQGFWDRDPADNRYRVFTNLQNFGKSEVSGLDLDMRYRIPRLAVGNLALRATATHYLQNRRSQGVGSEWEQVLGSYATPRVRATFSASLDKGPWAGTLAYRWVGGFWDSDVYTSSTQTRPEEARKVPGMGEVDLTASYAGFKNLRIDFGIRNLLNEMPPYSEQNAASNRYTQMGFAELYSARGRFAYARLTYQFR